VLAQLTHTAPRSRNRWSSRTRVSEHPPMFLQRFLETAPPSLRGVLRSVPPPHRYYEALRPPASRFAALRCLRLAIPPLRPVCSQRPGRTTVGSGELVFRFPSRNISVEMAGSPRFLGNPCVPMPCSQTPVGSRTPGHYGASTWPPTLERRRLLTRRKISGLNRTALGLAVYASSWRSPDTTQDSLPAARPSLAGRDLGTRRVAMKGF
jgi:hypothetical protein